MRLFTALAGIVLAFAGFAHAGSIGTQHSQKAEKAKKGTLKIAAASNVGGLRLEPGEYEGGVVPALVFQLVPLACFHGFGRIYRCIPDLLVNDRP